MDIRNHPPPTPVAVHWQTAMRAGLLLGLAVFCASIVGVYSRYDSALASIWPANALMVGFLLRLPSTARWPGWLCAGAAFTAADLLTGSAVLVAVVLSAANMVGVASIYLIYRRLPQDTLLIRAPTSMLSLGLACALGAAMAGFIGAFANPLLFNGDAAQGWVLWFVTEFANYIAILPVILSAPAIPSLRRLLISCPAFDEIRARPQPLLGLLLVCLAMLYIGGPGAIAFPAPLLLWCALRYTVFTTSVLTLFTSVWAMTLIAQVSDYDQIQMISLRIGVALLALGPVTLACLMDQYRNALSALEHLAAHDSLTAAQTRADFLLRARERLADQDGPVAVMMIDLDHFKQINDRYGHPAGDQVLVTSTARIRHCLRNEDLLGRMGGEEFAVLISGVSNQQVLAIAERIRESVAGSAITLEDQQTLSVTTSIGLTIRSANSQASIEVLLSAADKALYVAKHAGRNQVVLGEVTPSEPVPMLT